MQGIGHIFDIDTKTCVGSSRKAALMGVLCTIALLGD